MKSLKKNELKLDKEVITSLSSVELSSVKGGATVYACTSVPDKCVEKTINICEVISLKPPCFETDRCTQAVAGCVFTKGGNPCVILSEGGLSKCYCQIETQLNC